jgi:hypothetical protein
MRNLVLSAALTLAPACVTPKAELGHTSIEVRGDVVNQGDQGTENLDSGNIDTAEPITDPRFSDCEYEFTSYDVTGGCVKRECADPSDSRDCTEFQEGEITVIRAQSSHPSLTDADLLGHLDTSRADINSALAENGVNLSLIDGGLLTETCDDLALRSFSPEPGTALVCMLSVDTWEFLYGDALLLGRTAIYVGENGELDAFTTYLHPELLTRSWRSTLNHEFGHGVGLAHSGSGEEDGDEYYTSLMYPLWSSDRTDVFGPHSRAWIANIYSD